MVLDEASEAVPQWGDFSLGTKQFHLSGLQVAKLLGFLPLSHYHF